MYILVRYFVNHKRLFLGVVLCLCISINVDAQHKKTNKKKTSSESSSHKKSTARHQSNSHSKKSKSSASRGKKSKHESAKSKKHSKRRSRHGRQYIDNDERSDTELVTVIPTEPVTDNSPLRQAFINPSEAAKPWVFWYWVQGNISREGITADLQAMKDAGIGGAFLISAKAKSQPAQVTQAFEDLFQFARSESQRIGIQLVNGQDKAPNGEFTFSGNDGQNQASEAYTGKPGIVWAKAFTGLSNNWEQYPSILKAICDRDLASGANRLVLNSFVHNPSIDHKPGITLDSTGIYFQRDQVWWKQGFAWITYLQRCQSVLQMGKPVTDTAGKSNDISITDSTSRRANNIVWTHRTDPEYDVYFISNQENKQRVVDLSLRVANKIPEMWDPVTGETYQCSEYNSDNGRTNLSLRLEPNGSFFIILRKPMYTASRKGRNWSDFKTVRSVDGVWQVNFDPKSGGPDGPVVFTALTSWSRNEMPGIKYYSGTADYLQTVKWNSNLVAHRQIWLDLGNVANAATVTINGIFCGVAWTPPYRIDITKALHTGYNKVHIEVSNTWANRLIGDHSLPESKRLTWTASPYNSEGKSLLPAGLLGPVKIVEIDRTKRD